jgi:hypothetical protein
MYQMINELLKIIQLFQHQSRQYFLILDESWFYFLIDYEIIWLLESKLPTEEEKNIIQAKDDGHNYMESSRPSHYRRLSENIIFECKLLYRIYSVANSWISFRIRTAASCYPSRQWQIAYRSEIPKTLCVWFSQNNSISSISSISSILSGFDSWWFLSSRLCEALSE